MNKFNHYVITGKLPPNEERKWTKTVRFGVMARTPEGACEAVRANNPDCVIHSVSHRGEIEYVWHE